MQIQEFEVACERLRFKRQRGIPLKQKQNRNRGAVGGSSERGGTLDLVGWLAACILGEAVVNIGLLMDALPGGALSAFLLAVLVSVINVGFLGAGSGRLTALIRRHTRTAVPFGIFAGIAGTAALWFNHLLGRHRETFTRMIEANELQVAAGGPAPPPPFREVFAGVGANPLTWELQPLLFAILGLCLCAVGFWKGFKFDQEAGRNEDKERSSTGSLLYQQAFEGLLIEYQNRMEDRREKIVRWFEELGHDLRRVNEFLEKMQGDHRNRCMHHLEHCFVDAYNRQHADKIDGETVTQHRRERFSEPQQPQEPKELKKANELMDRWEKSGKKELGDALVNALRELNEAWKRYEHPVCA